jgi:hypothetical protein
MFLKDNRYAGDINLSHIGIWPDPSAVINLFSKAQNPYRGDFGFEMNTLNNLVVDDTYELLLKRVMDQ